MSPVGERSCDELEAAGCDDVKYNGADSEEFNPFIIKPLLNSILFPHMFLWLTINKQHFLDFFIHQYIIG